MALTDIEAEQAYNELTDALRHQKLSWIVAEVEERIAVGRLATQKLDVEETPDIGAGTAEIMLFEERSSSRGRRPRRTKGMFVVSEPFSPQERLALLLEGILLGTADLTAIAADVVAFAGEELQQNSLVFEPEAEVEPSFIIDAETTALAAVAAERLRALVGELQAEVNSAAAT